MGLPIPTCDVGLRITVKHRLLTFQLRACPRLFSFRPLLDLNIHQEPPPPEHKAVMPAAIPINVLKLVQFSLSCSFFYFSPEFLSPFRFVLLSLQVQFLVGLLSLPLRHTYSPAISFAVLQLAVTDSCMAASFSSHPASFTFMVTIFHSHPFISRILCGRPWYHSIASPPTTSRALRFQET